MRKKLKRLLSLVMVFSMTMSLLSGMASATGGDNSQQITGNGGIRYYDANGKILESATSLSGDAVVSLQKSIAPTADENYFDITLDVKTTTNIKEIYEAQDMDVVIVMDISNSMEIGNEDGTSKTATNGVFNYNDGKVSRYDAAMSAATKFINDFQGTSASVNDTVSRNVGFVAFNTDAHEIFGLNPCKSVADATGMINDMTTETRKILGTTLYQKTEYNNSYKRFTNIESGLKMAQDMLSESNADHKYIIFLSDGRPTTYSKSHSDSAGTGYNGWSPYMSGTAKSDGLTYLNSGNAVYVTTNPDWSTVQNYNKDSDGYFRNRNIESDCTLGTNYSDKGAKYAQERAGKIRAAGISVFSIGIGVSTMSDIADNYLTDRSKGGTYYVGSNAASFKSWLRNNIGGIGAGVTAVDGLSYYYDGDDTTALNNAFTTIFNQIKAISEASVKTTWVSTDPMNLDQPPKQDIEFLGFYEKNSSGTYSADAVLKAFNKDAEKADANYSLTLSGSSAEKAENTASIGDPFGAISWDLKNSGFTQSGNIFTYQMKYRVRLANEQSGFNKDTDYATNGTTKLTYQVETDGELGEQQEGEFRVPRVKGYLGSFSFIKKDAYSDVSLSGAKFTLRHDADCSVCGGTVSIADKSAESVNGGEVAFNNIPSGHTYTLVETDAPDNYVLNSAEYDVTVAYGRTTVTDSNGAEVYDSADESHNMVVTNELDPKPIQVTVNKTWVGDTASAAGVTVTVDIYDSRDVEVVEGKSQPKSGVEPKDTVEITTQSGGTGSATSKDLPSVDVTTGEKISYVAIERVDGSYKQVGISTPADYEITITNLMNKEKELTITKTWVAPETYHKEVLVQIYQDGEPYGDPITVDGSATVNVPTYRENGTNEQYVYTVAEVDAEGNVLTQYTHKDKTFTATVTGMDITNTIAQDYTSIGGNKTWNIASWPEEDKTNVTATITLYADDEPVGTVDVTYPATTYSFGVETVEGEDGATTLTLPKYALPGNKFAATVGEDGHEITYTVEETYAGGNNIEGTQSGNDFTNTLTGTIDIEGTKTWVDEGEDTRPATITINLLRDGVEIDEVVLKAKTTYENGAPIYGEVPAEGGEAPIIGYEQVEVEPDLSYQFSDLPKYDGSGREYVYTVTEDAVRNYATTQDGYDFTNTLDGGEKTLTVSKVWNDAGVNHGEDEVSFGVYTQNGLYTTITLPTEEGAWTKSVTVDLYDGGKTLHYYVRELDSDGNPIEEDGAYGENYTVSYAKAGDSWTVTNTINQETVAVPVTKEWNGNGSTDLQVKVDLMSGGTKVTEVTLPIAEVDPTTGEPIGAVSWSYTFQDLPKYAYDSETGVASIITYTIKEEMIGDQKLIDRYEDRETVKDDETGGYVITNNFDDGDTSVAGEKKWIAGGHSEEVWVALFADGVQKDAQITVGLQYAFTNLPAYNADGSNIVYTVKELTGENGTPIDEGGTYQDKYTVNYNGYTITNKLSDLESTDVSVIVNKVWNGPVPEVGSVTFNVTRASNETVDASWSDTITLNNSNAVTEGSNIWSGKLEGLAKYDAAGYRYTYFVSEAGVVDGKITVDGIEYTSTAEDANTFVNTVVDPQNVSLTVEKLWESATDKDADPDSVTLQLLADGVKVDEVTLPKEDAEEGSEWKHTFENKPVYDANTYKEITYTVKEMGEQDGVIALHGNSQRYFVTYASNDAGVTVTNTLKDVDAYYYKVHRYYKTVINGVTNEYYDNDAAYTETAPGLLNIDAMQWVDCATDDLGIVYTFLKDPTNVTQGNNGTYTFAVDEKNVVGFDVVKYTKAEGEAPNYYYDVYLNYIYEYNSTDISGRKFWDDNNDQDGLRPESITIRLWADGTEIDSEVVTAADGWKWSFTDLDKYKDGEEITYTITEDAVPGYTTEVDGYDVINTHETEDTQITVKKVWKDDGNRDGLRPASISVQLFADGAAMGEPVTLTAESGWTYTWNGLDQMSGGKTISYTVAEVGTVEGYTSSVNGFTITNTHEVEKTSVSGSKTWKDSNDQDGKRPASITINLLADGEKIDSKVVTAADGWKWNFTGLNKNENGKAINYTITEDAVPGYSTEVNGYDVTNSYTPGKTSVTVNKVWKDDGNRDGLRPASISVQLFADGAAMGEPVTLTAESGWTYTWNGLDQMSGGKTISYSVAEVGAVAGYTSSVNGFTITNTHEVEKTSVSGSKTWNDAGNQDGKRPASITINLLANGEKIDSKVVTAADGWKWNFTGLNKNEGGKAITYTITEDAVPGYSTEVNGYDVTNSYTPGKTSVTVNKVWKDDGNRDGLRPASISVQLLADGAAKGEPVTLTAENGWTYTWTGLDEMSGGKSISYSVAEVGTVAGYTSSVNGFTITNTHEVKKTSIDVEKVWERTSNPPEIDVIIKLLADGEEVKTLKLNEDNEWKGTFSDLPVNKDGKAITYTIEEVEVSGYTTKITGSAADGFTVTNTKEGDRPNDEEEEDEPSGGSKDVTYTLKADKTLDGKKANGFTFQVKDADGDVVATASAKSGKITFPTFRYDTEGTYTYTVSEVVGTNSNVTYDDSVYTLTVTVIKSGEELVAERTELMKDGEAVESILFENTYDGERFYDDDEEELFEEDIPLGGLAAPETGDAGMLWALTAAVSGMGLAGLNFFPKKRKEDEE